MKADKNKITDFFNKLSDMNCITPVWQKVLDVLIELQSDISFEALALLCIYFSHYLDNTLQLAFLPSRTVRTMTYSPAFRRMVDCASTSSTIFSTTPSAR